MTFTHRLQLIRVQSNFKCWEFLTDSECNESVSEWVSESVSEWECEQQGRIRKEQDKISKRSRSSQGNWKNGDLIAEAGARIKKREGKEEREDLTKHKEKGRERSAIRKKENRELQQRWSWRHLSSHKEMNWVLHWIEREREWGVRLGGRKKESG